MSLYLYLLNAVLLTRLPLLLRDTPVSIPRIVACCFVQLACLLPLAFNSVFAAIAIFGILLPNLAWCYLERNDRGLLPARRLCILLIQALAFAIYCSPSFCARFDPRLGPLADAAKDVFLPLSLLKNMRWDEFHACLAGVLLSLNESNLVVRCAFEKLVFRPPATGDTSDVIGQAEYNRGRLIGLLERLLIFFLVLQQQYTALGFVLTAKSIARFKELENRDFAEYFLIGTLLSIVIAGSIALVTRALLS